MEIKKEARGEEDEGIVEIQRDGGRRRRRRWQSRGVKRERVPLSFLLWDSQSLTRSDTFVDCIKEGRVLNNGLGKLST